MPSDLIQESRLSKNPQVVGQTVDSEVVLVLLEKNQIKVLNEVGTRIWELVDGERTIAEISRILCDEFNVDEQESLEDAIEFLEELLIKGIVSLHS